jgi:HAD superfamily hydrolase (TIGR01509 family)
MKQHYTNELIAERLCPTPEHVYATWRLAMEGLRLAVASNSIRATVDFMIRKAELTKYFEYLLSNEDVVHAKPSPQIYHRAMELLGVTPETTLIVEDSPFGLQAATHRHSTVLKVDTVMDVQLRQYSQPNSRDRIGTKPKASCPIPQGGLIDTYICTYQTNNINQHARAHSLAKHLPKNGLFYVDHAFHSPR